MAIGNKPRTKQAAHVTTLKKPDPTQVEAVVRAQRHPLIMRRGQRELLLIGCIKHLEMAVRRANNTLLRPERQQTVLGPMQTGLAITLTAIEVIDMTYRRIVP
jgi:hypothetical protein